MNTAVLLLLTTPHPLGFGGIDARFLHATGDGKQCFVGIVALMVADVHRI